MAEERVNARPILVKCFDEDGKELMNFVFYVRVEEASLLMCHILIKLSGYHYSDLDVRMGNEIKVNKSDIWNAPAIDECIHSNFSLSKQIQLTKKIEE